LLRLSMHGKREVRAIVPPGTAMASKRRTPGSR